MAMNTQHLQYIIEIERTRSISQAAENLFIGQPNLSRILHDVEQMLGFRIFERSTRGVRPTTRGTIFLQHAKSILRETEAIEALGPKRAVANRLRVCIPRSAAMLDLTAQYLAGLPQAEPVDAVIRECHARTALETLASGETEIGVIRFRSEYRDYFDEQTSARGLSFELLSKYHYLVTRLPGAVPSFARNSTDCPRSSTAMCSAYRANLRNWCAGRSTVLTAWPRRRFSKPFRIPTCWPRRSRSTASSAGISSRSRAATTRVCISTRWYIISNMQ